MKFPIYTIVILLLCVGCERYNSKPYDEWEVKLRGVSPASAVKDMLIKENWQEYDSLSYLRFTNLEQIILDTDSIPPWITSFKNLESIYSSNRKIRQLPEDIHKLSKLEYIYITNGELETIPSSIKELKRLRVLNLDGNNISHIPEVLTDLDTLYTLSLENNKLTEVPDHICQINGLQYLSLSKNEIKEIPECIGDLSQLEYLGLYNNQIAELPENIANLSLLEDLVISGNPVTKLPEGLFTKPNRLTNIHLNNTPLKEDEQVNARLKELFSKNRKKQKEEYLKERDRGQ